MNARSVPPARDGGVHGHLAMLLTAKDYLLRAGVAFIVPVHPGVPPLFVGTAAVIAIALCAYTDAIADVTVYNITGCDTATVLGTTEAARHFTLPSGTGNR
jgi:hypothetical protein